MTTHSVLTLHCSIWPRFQQTVLHKKSWSREDGCLYLVDLLGQQGETNGADEGRDGWNDEEEEWDSDNGRGDEESDDDDKGSEDCGCKECDGDCDWEVEGEALFGVDADGQGSENTDSLAAVPMILGAILEEGFLRTLGMEHAFSSFIWLCGPITGLRVAQKRLSHGDATTSLLVQVSAASLTVLSRGVIGLLSIPSALVFLVGMVLSEPHIPNFDYKQVFQKLLDATKAMWDALKCPEVWRPCT
ncbi:hypothetical protein NE237_010707 [Protea cynaroides]|uniref:Uncharacterized protein n=1 Tax=Protea cynaroides TaxID=273540 RepID=A0A9Q0KZU6_9MAGN|nr:hypothetical protein NE237_010707 [Protea cynaroides]